MSRFDATRLNCQVTRSPYSEQLRRFDYKLCTAMYRARAFYHFTQASLHHFPQLEFYEVGESGLRSIAHQ